MKLRIILFSLVLFFLANSGWTEEAGEEWFKKGVESIKAENYKEAVYYFKKTIDLHPNHLPSYNNLGYLYNIMGKWDEAIETYKKALDINPNDVRIHHDLGFSLYKKGMFDEAIAHLKKAIALNSEFEPPYHILGVIYLEKKMFNEAVSVLKKALEFTPDYPAAYRDLGQAYKEVGKNILGADHYYQAGILYLKENNREEALIAYKNILYCSKEIAAVFLKKLYPAKEASEPTMLLSSKKKNQWYTLLTKMNIRKDHSSDSKNIGQLDRDIEFQIIREAPDNTPLNSWYLIKTKTGFSGWLCGVYKGIVKYEIAAERKMP
ncbi:MAG: tetratricopeptide repeat protein [Deltaproteobacteria bacterium]|nr:tetratricopeptide repeat protein [Deltaproteobacteria bacterium]MBW2660762.1 tetratricopeptide repeat protein [Deltaproteobacteria bacterium]